MTDVQPAHRARIPRDREHDYTDEMAHKRQAFVAEKTGAGLEHVGTHSFDPPSCPRARPTTARTPPTTRPRCSSRPARTSPAM
jgi:hypothetical protein